MSGIPTYVYVDGFNLYFGAVRRTPYKWLDPAAMCARLLPGHDVQRIRYFTARVSARPSNPNAPVHQQMYLRALSTIETLTIHYGHFLQHVVRMPAFKPGPGQERYPLVVKTEEKGSDVNIATHLVADGYEERYACAVLVTNDSDLVEPVRIVRERLGRSVGILNPHQHPSRHLKKHATFFKRIRPGVLRVSQFPNDLADRVGRFHKPSAW